jgi:DNA helicase IV
MTLSQTNSASASAIGQEQSYLEMLYRLLDQARDRTESALTETLGTGGAGGTFQARVERDFTATEQSRRLAQLNAVEHGLCFGRTDAEPTADRPGTLYIGRIGLRDDEHEPRLIDWRAPAAHPFYAATPRDPNGLIRRRHIYTRNRTVTGSTTRSSTWTGCRSRTAGACPARPC